MQDVNLFVVDGRRNGPLLSKCKGDSTQVLVERIHQCTKMLARGHAGTPHLLEHCAFCIVRHEKEIHVLQKLMFSCCLFCFVLFGEGGSSVCSLSPRGHRPGGESTGRRCASLTPRIFPCGDYI